MSRGRKGGHKRECAEGCVLSLGLLMITDINKHVGYNEISPACSGACSGGKIVRVKDRKG